MNRETARLRTIRGDLCRSIADGTGFGFMVGASEAYLPAFVLALGYGEVAAGLIASLPQVAGAVLQLISPWAVRRLRSHRRWVVLAASLQGLSFVPLIVGAASGRLPLSAIFAIATLYWAAGLASSPAWNTWMGRLIPARLRAPYLARRAGWCHAAVLLGVVGSGTLLHWGEGRTDVSHWFAVAFLAAGAARLVSAALLALQQEPPLHSDDFRMLTFGDVLGRLQDRGGRLLVYVLATQIAVQVSAPFFSPFMLKQMHLPYAPYMTLLAVALLAKFLSAPLLGRIARRWGARRLLWVGGLGIVPLPGVWLLSDNLGYLAATQIASGISWAAYELATMLLYFETIHSTERTSVLSVFNLANAVAMLAGSLIGGAILWQLDQSYFAYVCLFCLSMGARLLTLPLLARLPDLRAVDLPIVTRTIAVRPSAGTIDRPVLAGIPEARSSRGAAPMTLD